MSFTVDTLRPEDWAAVRTIYQEGIATQNATFETDAPEWEAWDQGHLDTCRFVVRESGNVVAWAALSPVSKRKVYAGVAKHEEAGYQIMELGLVTSVPKVKPKLTKCPLEGAQPPPSAIKGTRDVYLNGTWHRAAIYNMDVIKPGNEIKGIAVVEAPATTFFIPPGRQARMDEWSLLWLT